MFSRRRNTRRAVPGLVLAAITVVTLLPHPGQAGERASAVATSLMKVQASTSAYTSLRIPAAAEFPLDYTDPVLAPPSFSPGTGLAAVVLVSSEDTSRAWMAVRLPENEGAVRPIISLGPKNCQVEQSCPIPPGDYRLYVVTEGAVTIDVPLHGLRGKSTVRPASPASVGISGATESYLYSTPAAPFEVAAHGAGFSPTLTGDQNLLFSAFWFKGPSDPAGPAPLDQPLLQLGDAGACFFNEAATARLYAPGCPGGQGAGRFSSAYALKTFGFMQWNASINIAPGTYGRGYYAVHTGIRHPGLTAFWIDLTL